MNFLYVHRTRATGVEAVHIGQIVLGLRRLGHQVRMLSPVGQFIEHVNPRPAEAAPAAAPAKVPAKAGREMPELLFECLELGYNLKAWLDGLRLGREQRVDGIYERYAIFGMAGLWLARRWGVPFVLEVNYTSLSPLVRQRSGLLKPLARWCDRQLFRGATQLLAVSSYLKDELVQVYGVSPDRVTVVPNAADPAVFDPVPARAQAPDMVLPAGPIIGFVGGFYKWHGLDLLVQAFLQVAQQHPQACLLLVGDGPMREEVAALARQHGLQDRVLMPGRVAHNRLAPYVARFDVGVMPDSNLYGSPMKVFEYMAMEVPVVVPDYGPLLDVVVDGRQGRIFKRRDVQDLARCLNDMLADAERRRQMGLAARQAIVERHNWLNNARLAAGHLGAKE
jgi:glycosyltransferase involved in cell wall biosynthesis